MFLFRIFSRPYFPMQHAVPDSRYFPVNIANFCMKYIVHELDRAFTFTVETERTRGEAAIQEQGPRARQDNKKETWAEKQGPQRCDKDNKGEKPTQKPGHKSKNHKEKTRSQNQGACRRENNDKGEARTQKQEPQRRDKPKMR